MGYTVDMSKWQKSSAINWPVFSKNVDMLLLRVQYGSLVVDSEYKNHVANAKKYKIPFMTYAFPQFVSVSDARVEARDQIKRTDSKSLADIIDIESEYDKNTKKPLGITKLSKKVRLDGIKAYVDELRKNGSKRVGAYIGHNVYESWGINTILSIFDFIWIPRYGVNNGQPSTKPNYPCDIWQYTEYGRVPGYDGNLDLNKLMGNKDLNWYLGVNTEKADIPKEVTKVPERDINKVSSWASEEWEYVTENGYFDGSRPGANITREESGIVTKRIIDNIRQYIVEPLEDKIKKLEEQVKELQKK